MTFRDQLIAMGACESAPEWVGARTLNEAWTECLRGDWLLWYAGRARARVDRRLLVLAACACARTALQCVPAGEDRPRLAIDTAEAWCRGEATIKEAREAKASTAAAVLSAAWAAWEAGTARSAALAAMRASWSAAYAVEAAAMAATAAEDAALAAAYAEAAADSKAAEGAAHVECARLVRELIPCPEGVMTAIGWEE